MKQFPGRRVAMCLAIGLVLSGPARAQAPAPAAAPVPGDRLIVRFHDEAVAPDMAGALVDAAMARAGIVSPRAVGARRLDPQVRRLGNGAALMRLPLVLDAAALQRVADALAADPRVRYAVPDRLRQAQQAVMVRPDDPRYPSHQWHLHDPVGGVNAPQAWALSRGAGTVVAVIDTGLLPGHPDLDPARLLPGYDFIADPFQSRRPGRGRAPGAQDQGDWIASVGECQSHPETRDSTWHGTHVAGTVVEATDNAVGMAGLAHQATLLPVRVLGRCGGWDSDIIDAITWASGGAVPGVPDNAHPADVINLSLGGISLCPRPYQEAIDAAVARGTVIVAAAGNHALDASLVAPANCHHVVSVAATGVTGAIAGYSNYGSRVDLAAPGGGGGVDGEIRGSVWQTGYSGLTAPTSGDYTYTPAEGTSMAAPHVAATVALVQSARVAAGRLPLSPARMTTLLKATARPFPVNPRAQRAPGAGIVDAAGAIRRAIDPACDVGVRYCTPPPPVLTNRVPVSAQAGDTGGRDYTFVAEAGRSLSFITYGGAGDVSLYVRHGATASPVAFDVRSTRPGNGETVRIRTPQAGVYHVHLAGVPSFEGVTIMARQ